MIFKQVEIVHRKPARAQMWAGIMKTILTSIGQGIPIAIDPVKKWTGKGAPRMGRSSRTHKQGGTEVPRIGVYWNPPLVICSWNGETVGRGKKKSGKGLILGKQSIQLNFDIRSNVIKPKFHENIPMSNFDLTECCKYLKMPINDVLSREQNVPLNQNKLYLFTILNQVIWMDLIGSQLLLKIMW